MLNYSPPNIEFPLSDGQIIKIRGLNASDIDYLFSRHGSNLMQVFEGEVDFMELMSIAPSIAADIIACAADERGASENAARMPFPLAVGLLTEIYTLTFQDIDLGNATRLILESIGNRAKSMNASMSSGASDAT